MQVGSAELPSCAQGRTWLPHMRLETILQSAMDLSVRLAQPRLRQISNRQRMRRPALSRMYCMSLPSASPSSFSLEMKDCIYKCQRQYPPHYSSMNNVEITIFHLPMVGQPQSQRLHSTPKKPNAGIQLSDKLAEESIPRVKAGAECTLRT